MIISIIIPTYKPQLYINECLDSIKNQTFSKEEFELILVLNGCNEPYYSQINDYINTNLVGYNVKLIQTDVGGVSNARNIALDHAKGKYVTFIDDDDYVSPNFLEELFEKAGPDTISLCYPYAFVDGMPDSQMQYSLTKVYDEFYMKEHISLSSRVRKFFSGPCMKLIPMSIIQDRRFDVRFKNGEDSLFMFEISDKFGNIVFTSRSAIYYRRFRQNSAYTSHKSISYAITNAVKMIMAYITIYRPGKYDFAFFVSRICGALKTIYYFSLFKIIYKK